MLRGVGLKKCQISCVTYHLNGTLMNATANMIEMQMTSESSIESNGTFYAAFHKHFNKVCFA